MQTFFKFDFSPSAPAIVDSEVKIWKHAVQRLDISCVSVYDYYG